MDLDIVIRKKGSVKQQLTVFRKYIEKIGQSVDDLTAVNITSRLSKIEALYQQFDGIQTQIEILENKLESESSSDREQFQDDYFDIIARAKHFCNKNDDLSEN